MKNYTTDTKYEVIHLINALLRYGFRLFRYADDGESQLRFRKGDLRIYLSDDIEIYKDDGTRLFVGDEIERKKLNRILTIK